MLLTLTGDLEKKVVEEKRAVVDHQVLGPFIFGE